MKKQICILGSTGSIGTQALDVIKQHSDRYETYCLTANNRYEMLAEQARQFRPAAVVIANEKYYEPLCALLADCPEIKVYAGAKALDEIVEAQPIDMVLTAMVGFAGLSPTIHAIKARKTICLANKETLVVAGELICRLAAENHVNILPVDSEHSAIFQSLVGEGNNAIEKILLTASGGPFRNFTLNQMRDVKAADALKHPTWEMGAKITIDSASMMNKGFEVIEAKWLFGVEADRIQVLVHPQSIVHSAVQFSDGAVKAQLGVPDMQKFRCLHMAYESIRQGGNMPCIVNAANEIVNEAFRKDKCGFLQMGEIIERTMQKATFIAKPTYDDYIATDAEARRIAEELLLG